MLDARIQYTENCVTARVALRASLPAATRAASPGADTGLAGQWKAWSRRRCHDDIVSSITRDDMGVAAITERHEGVTGVDALTVRRRRGDGSDRC